MKTIRLALAALAVLALVGAAAHAQSSKYDGLTLLGVGHEFVDQDGSSLDLMAFQTKYGEKVVGMYFTQGNTSIHFYMNAAIWDKLKQRLIRARDQWDTLSPTEFQQAGATKGYTIGNQRATLLLGLQGATALQPRQLLLTGTGGAAAPQRVVINLMNQDLADLVDDFYKVDNLLRGTPSGGN